MTAAAKEISKFLLEDSFAQSVQPAPDLIEKISNMSSLDEVENLFKLADEGSETCPNDDTNYAVSSLISKLPTSTRTEEQLGLRDRVSVYCFNDEKYYSGAAQHLHRVVFKTIISGDSERKLQYRK